MTKNRNNLLRYCNLQVTNKKKWKEKCSPKKWRDKNPISDFWFETFISNLCMINIVVNYWNKSMMNGMEIHLHNTDAVDCEFPRLK